MIPGLINSSALCSPQWYSSSGKLKGWWYWWATSCFSTMWSMIHCHSSQPRHSFPLTPGAYLRYCQYSLCEDSICAHFFLLNFVNSHITVVIFRAYFIVSGFIFEFPYVFIAVRLYIIKWHLKNLPHPICTYHKKQSNTYEHLLSVLPSNSLGL